MADEPLYEIVRKEMEQLRAENLVLRTQLSSAEHMSVDMARIYAKAKVIEREMYDAGTRYENWVIIFHEEATYLAFRYAFAVLFYDEQHGNWGDSDHPGQWLLVFTEHHGMHIYPVDDLYGYEMLGEMRITRHSTYAALDALRSRASEVIQSLDALDTHPESGDTDG